MLEAHLEILSPHPFCVSIVLLVAASSYWMHSCVQQAEHLSPFSQQGLIQAGTVGLSCAYRKACR